MAESAGRRNIALVVQIQNRVCTLPLAHVIETMRPLPIEPLAGVASFVRGVSIIRGIATPVVDLGAVLGASPCDGERLVTIRVGERQVALCVDAVIGIREIDQSAIPALPPLLQGTSKDTVETIGTLDDQLLMIFRASWELPDEVWQALTAQEAVT